MSAILKAPSNVYLVPGTIPLIPGGALYYTMKSLIDGNEAMFKEKLIATATVTVGLATGIIVGTVLITYIKEVILKKNK